MSRADRLLRLAHELRASAETTAARLADTLGVSERTVWRDLAALRDQGLPIVGDPGRGGGIRLDGRRGVTAVHLGMGEIVALWLAARLSQGAGELPWSRNARSALAKLLGSLPKDRGRELRDLCSRVWIGPPATESVRRRSGQAPPELLRHIEEAITIGVALEFAYHDREGKRTLRRVEPHGLLVQSPVWYLLTRDTARMAPRMFRMDRIARPEVIRAHRFVPDARVARELLEPGFPWTPLLES